MSQLIIIQLLIDLIAVVMHLGIRWQMGEEPPEGNRGPSQPLAVLLVHCVARFCPFLLHDLVRNSEL